MATLNGTAGNDSLVGTAENDSIVSGGGVDTLRGLAGNDYYVVSDALSVIIELPGGGYDTESIEGSYDQHWTVPDNIEWFRWANPSGADPRFTFFEFDGNAQDNLIQLFNGRVSVNGGAGNDTISANADSYGVSTVRGGAGDDELYGSGSGTYYLDGGEGDDTLTASTKNDFLQGGPGNDELHGGKGKDTLDGGPGFDVLYGGEGDDTYLFNDLDDFAVEKPNEGDDTIIVSINGAKVDATNIEHVVYVNDALPLAYWLDALLVGASYQPFGLGVELTYGFPDNDADPSFSAFDADDRQAVRNALTAWAASTNLRIQEVPAALADMRFGFADLTAIKAAGVTYFENQGALVFIDRDAMGGSLTIDPQWFEVLLHEVGHALWLKHPGNYNGVDGAGEPPFLGANEDNTNNTVMSYHEGTAGVYASTPRPFDEAAAQYIYGVNPNVHAGNTVYRYGQLSWPNTLIADGSGIDVIDASAVVPSGVGAADMTIDLRAGSRIYAGAPQALITAPGQVSINYGTVIENAIGSVGRDDIWGNEANNSLAGGLGNDTIHGSLGNDTLVGGDGDDWLDGGLGADVVQGGAGNDTIVFAAGLTRPAAERDTITGGAGDDVLEVRVDLANIDSAVASDLAALRTGVSGSRLFASLGIELAEVERLRWTDAAGAPVSNFAPFVPAATLLSLDEDVSTGARAPMAIDIDGDTLTYTLVSNVVNGQLTFNGDGRFVYVPNADYSGDDRFTYTVSDGKWTSQPLEQAIQIRPVDDAPRLRSPVADVNGLVGRALRVALPSDMFVDPEGKAISFTVTQASGAPLPSWLTFDNSPTNYYEFGRLIGTPGPADVGILRLRVTASDGRLTNSDEFLVGVHATPNAAPTVADLTLALQEDGSALGHLPGFVDADGDIAYVDWTYPAPHGRVQITASGVISYTPNANFHGTDVITYFLSDGRGGSVVGHVSAIVESVDDPATGAISFSGKTQMGAVLTAVPINIADPDGFNPTFNVYQWLRNGSPIDGANKSEYAVRAGDVGARLSVSLTITDYDDYHATFVSAPSSVVPEPPSLQGTSGADLIDRSASIAGVRIDALDGKDTVIGSVWPDWILGSNGDDDIAGAGGADVLSGGPGNDTIRDATSDFNVIDGGPGDDRIYLTWGARYLLNGSSTVSGGEGDDTLYLTVRNEQWSFGLLADLIRLRDGIQSSKTWADFGLTLSGLEHLGLTTPEGVPLSNTPPAASTGYDVATTQIDEGKPSDLPFPIALDFEGDKLTFTPDFVNSGTVKVGDKGQWTFTPNAGYDGQTTLFYTVSDGHLSSSGYMWIWVHTNEAPVLAEPLSDQQTLIGQVLDFGLKAGSFRDSDSKLRFSAELANGAPLPAWLHFNADTLHFSGLTSASDAGLLNVRVIATDGQYSVDDTFLLGVHLTVNHVPVLSSDVAQVDEDKVLEARVPVSDTDGDTVTCQLLAGPMNGALELQADGHYRYTPKPNFNGADSFRFSANDGRGGSSEQTIHVTVTPQPDPVTGAIALIAAPHIGTWLYAVSTLADADGNFASVGYSWLRGGVPIPGATQAHYRVTLADTGNTLSIQWRIVGADGAIDIVTSEIQNVPRMDTLIGTAAADSLVGTAADDSMIGAAGNDTLIGNGGNDSLEGGVGNDVLYGGDGIDTLSGGDGDDVADYRDSVTLNIDLRIGFAQFRDGNDELNSIEAIFGSRNSDFIFGRDGPANLYGETVRGGLGDDRFYGGTGVDTAEYLGTRSAYQVSRHGPLSSYIFVQGPEGNDENNDVERFIFADQMLAFGQRADEVAKVAIALWGVGVAHAGSLFARGISFYDVGYDYNTLIKVALTFFPDLQGAALARQLLANVPGTSHTEAELVALMNSTGSVNDAGRIAATQLMADDFQNMQTIDAEGLRVNGIVCDLSVPGFGTLFSYLPG